MYHTMGSWKEQALREEAIVSAMEAEALAFHRRAIAEAALVDALRAAVPVPALSPAPAFRRAALRRARSERALENIRALVHVAVRVGMAASVALFAGATALATGVPGELRAAVARAVPGAGAPEEAIGVAVAGPPIITFSATAASVGAVTAAVLPLR